MKQKIVIIGIIVLLLFLVGCTKTPTGSTVVDDGAYKELCKSNGHMFMTMNPMVDGTPTGEPSCAGCMVGANHYCGQEEYLKALKSNSEDMSNMDNMNMG